MNFNSVHKKVIIFFSTLIYFLERDEPETRFVSIPATFWWCLFSQTKWVPATAGTNLNNFMTEFNHRMLLVGKVAGGAGITFGVLVLALPIAILVIDLL